MQKKYISYWNHTLQHSQKLNFHYKIETNYGPPACLDLTRKNPSRRTLVKVRITHKLGLRQVDTTIYHVIKGYADSEIITEL